jgi:ligand-binding sensor domain-containing protein/class 3 adenylate cyclase
MKTNQFIIFAAILSAAAFIPAPAGADSVGKPEASFLSDYVSRIWSTSDGLPGNTVTDIVQTSDGYIYMGSYEGLIRFDGIDFEISNRNTNSKLGFIAARTVFQDSGNRLWVGSNDEGVFCIEKKNVTAFSTQDGLPNDSIRSFAEDPDHNIWVATSSGVVYITPENKIGHPRWEDPSNPDRSSLILSLYCDTAGRIWITTPAPGGIYCLAAHRGFSRYTGILPGENYVVTAVSQDSDGGFFFGTQTGKIIKVCPDGNVVYTVSFPKSKSAAVQTIFADKDGKIWFGTDGGIAILSDGRLFYYTEADGLADNNVNDIMQDREGNMWFVTDRGGVQKMRIGRFKTITLPTTINAIAEGPDGRVWLGGDDGLYCFSNFVYEENSATQYCKNVRIRDVGFTRDGALLVSTYAKLGQLLMTPDMQITSWTETDGLSGNKVRVALEAENGDLYVGTTTGLSIINRTSGTITNLTTEDGLPKDYIMCLFQNDDGSLWVGTDSGGIAVLNSDNKIERILNSDNGLAGDVIFKILKGPEGSLWICTGSGLTCYKNGRFFTYNTANGLGQDAVFQVLFDYSGNMWMTSNKGVSAVKSADMNALADGKAVQLNPKFYTQNDGLRSEGVTSTSLSMKDSLGRIWFTLIDGFAVYNPLKKNSNMTAPLVQIKSVTLDGKKTVCYGDPVIVPAGTKRITIDYTGLSFISPELISYHGYLDGFDSEIPEWNSSRQVSYTNLKPGDYTFHVTAENNDGIVSKKPAELQLTQKAYFYQLPLFWFFSGILIFSIVIAFIQYRLYRMRQYQLRLETEVRIKTHDLAVEKEKSERLLLNILPEPIAEELKADGNRIIAKHFTDVSVLFADIVEFTRITTDWTAEEIVRALNRLFTKFDLRAQREGIEKIKTIGDAYMAVCGLPNTDTGHAVRLARFALGLFDDINAFNEESNIKFSMRIGINSGDVVAGVIGKTKFIYDVWGNTVNVACRMQQLGRPGTIHVTDVTRRLTESVLYYGEPVELDVKGKGRMKTFFASAVNPGDFVQ